MPAFLDGQQGVGRPACYAARRSDCLRLLPTASSRRPISTRPIAAPIRLHFRQRPVRLVLRSSLASPPCRFVPARASTNQRRQVYLQRPSCLETIRLSSTQLAVKDSASIPASSQAHASADPLRPPSPVSSLRLVSESSAIGQCCCRRRCCCCFWSRPPPPPPHVWSQVTRGIDQRSSRVHISSSSGTGHAMPRPNLCPHSRARARAAFCAPVPWRVRVAPFVSSSTAARN